MDNEMPKLQRPANEILASRSRLGRKMNSTTKTAAAVKLMFCEGGATQAEILKQTGLRMTNAWVEREAARRHVRVTYLDRNHWRLWVCGTGNELQTMLIVKRLSRD